VVSVPKSISFIDLREAREIWEYMTRRKSFTIAFAFLILMIAVAILAPYIAPYDPVEQNVPRLLKIPSLENLMGTDQYGRDVFSRVLYGAQASLSVGFVSIALAATIGILLGMIGAYRGGLADTAVMRFMDIMFAFPSVVLAIAIMAALGPGVLNVILVVVFVSIPQFARMARSTIITEKEKPYVVAIKGTGASTLRIVFQHLLPNSMAPTIVQSTIMMAWAILTESALSFLGVGIRPPTPSWGWMLNDGRAYLITGQWWLILFPGLAITLTVLALNFVGDTLRDAFDPRVRRRGKTL
jgi:ABC-type dipeptide/oligopeptide/nickel transport system permease subunit